MQDFREIMAVGNKKQAVRTPQFPGVITGNMPGKDVGAMIEFVRSVIKKQKRARGFKFGLEPGDNKFTIELSGTARTFLGFALLIADPEAQPIEAAGIAPALSDLNTAPQTFTLNVNNEIIIQDVFPVFFAPDFMDDEYYYFPRPLSGTDTIEVEIESTQDQNMWMVVYYI